MLSYLDQYVLSYYNLYLLVSGIVGENNVIKCDKSFEAKLLQLMSENLAYVESLAIENDVNALYIMGSIYLDGIICVKNLEKAKEYYLKGAKYNCSFCLNDLGFLYTDIGNEDSAEEYYNMAAELGNFYAKNNVCGLNIRKNFELEKYMKILHELSNSNNNFFLSQKTLGFYYLGRKEYKNAFIYFLKAAENGSIVSMEKLAEFYEKGLYVSKDQNMALYWKAKAECQ